MFFFFFFFSSRRRHTRLTCDWSSDVCSSDLLSHYQLTLEPGTLFAAQPPPLPDEDLAWDMQGACHAVLAGRGYAQYEVSAFAQSGRQCRHNLNYWRFGDYLGLGAGAHGKLTHLASSAEREAGQAPLVI